MIAQLESNILDDTLQACKKTLLITWGFSFASNILMLALPIFTLQVLDRVISSASVETLFMLAIIVIGLFISMGLIQVARSFTLIRMGKWLDNTLATQFLKHSITLSSLIPGKSDSQNLRDLSTLRNFLTGPGLISIMDMPWSLIYMLVIFLIHPINGLIVLVGSVILLLLALFNENSTKKPLNEANDAMVSSMRLAEIATRNAEVVEGMGMGKYVIANWLKRNNVALDQQSVASNRAATILAISRGFRMILQVSIITSGAILALNNALTVGGIIGCSILAGRAFAPFDNAISSWKSVVEARKSYYRLKETVSRPILRREGMKLPTPTGEVVVEQAVYSPQPGMLPILAGINFAVQPGEVIGIVGPSAAGKSTLAKLLVGVWKPLSGAVRLDGADIYSWARDDFGDHMGYLPQDVELFSGTVKANIARMNEDASPDMIAQAAKDAGVHELILQLPQGYETQIGFGGASLSAGQRQRVGLARAFFGNPKVIVLDEPNANLDEAGEIALRQSILLAKQNKTTVFIISHRPSILSVVDKILVLQGGKMTAFGNKDDVLRHIAPQAVQPQASAQPTASPQAATRPMTATAGVQTQTSPKEA